MSGNRNFAQAAGHQIALGVLCDRVGEELLHLAALSAVVQQALSLFHFAEHTDAAAIRGLQGIDRITQSLDDLARLVRALAEQVPADQRLQIGPLLAGLRLHELQTRLGFDATPSPQVPCVLAPGEIHWL